MRLSISFAAFVVTALGSISAQAQTCLETDPEVCNAAGDVEFCDPNTLTLQTLNCAETFNATGAFCGPLDCDGVDCPADRITCTNARGGACLGIATLFDGDESDNARELMTVTCGGSDACVVDTGTGAETCQAGSGVPACTAADAGLRCVGNKIVGCIGFVDAVAAVTTPGVSDCASFGVGFLCVEDTVAGTVGCQNPDCGAEGFGSCDGTTAIQCSGGEEQNRENCATFGQACVQDTPTSSPQCITADPECGAGGNGVCNGQEATICQGGSFVSTTNCAASGLVCGVVPGTNRIGCNTPGSGEGEGEGEAPAECEDDNDCDDDEECDDGECVSDRPRRGGGAEEPVPAPGLFSCAETPLAGAPLLALGLAGTLMLRRRRR